MRKSDTFINQRRQVFLMRQCKTPSFYMIDRLPSSRRSRVLTKRGKPAISFLLGIKLIEAIFWPAKRRIRRKPLGFGDRFLKGREEEKASYKYEALFTKKGIFFLGHGTEINRRQNPKLSHLSIDMRTPPQNHQSRKKA